jgi:putative transposase
VKYAWIKEQRDSYPVQTMCRVLAVSNRGSYKWLSATPSPRAQRREAIKAGVRRVYEYSRGIYGSAKISQELRNSGELETACRHTVAKAMKEMWLKSRVSKQFRPTTTVADPSRQAAANLLKQEFTATGPNQKWVTGITYLPTSRGWVYLAVVLDLFSRKVVGWAVSHSLATTLISDAFRQAIENSRPAAGQLLHHRDRGCQYTSEAF